MTILIMVRGGALAGGLRPLTPARVGLVLGIALLVAATPGVVAYEETQVDDYVASLGASADGLGAALNAGPFGPGRYSAAQPVTHVDVRAFDDSGVSPWLTVCVDVNNDNLCSSADGDVQAAGAGVVAVDVPPHLAFRVVQVYAYALGAGAAGDVHAATTGTLEVRFAA